MSNEVGGFALHKWEADEMLAWLEKQGEQKSIDKAEPKFKVGDIMRTLQEASDGIKDGLPVVVSIDDECYHCNNEIIPIADQENYEYPPKNRKQSIAWSGEDDYNVQCLVAKVVSDIQKGNVGRNQELIDWLKSLKDRIQPQNCWKPSEEQIKALKWVLQNIPYNIHKQNISDMLEQLKKL